ncbi:hypothetical protein D3C80_1280330 [compost metagenome]
MACSRRVRLNPPLQTSLASRASPTAVSGRKRSGSVVSETCARLTAATIDRPAGLPSTTSRPCASEKRMARKGAVAPTSASVPCARQLPLATVINGASAGQKRPATSVTSFSPSSSFSTLSGMQSLVV